MKWVIWCHYWQSDEGIFTIVYFNLKMCQKSALKCQLTCLYVLYTVNPSPLPLATIHNVMRGEKIFSTKYTKCWVNYQLLYSVAEVTQWCSGSEQGWYGWGHEFKPTTCWIFFSVNTFCQKDVVGITRHVVTTISVFSFTMLLLDRILTHIVNHISNTSYHLQYVYCQRGYVFGAKPNLITCVGYIFLSAYVSWLICSSF
jgi:hypothetical protein